MRHCTVGTERYRWAAVFCRAVAFILFATGNKRPPWWCQLDDGLGWGGEKEWEYEIVLGGGGGGRLLLTPGCSSRRGEERRVVGRGVS